MTTGQTGHTASTRPALLLPPGITLRRLGPERTDEVHRLMLEVCTANVMPPGYQITLDDVQSLLDLEGEHVKFGVYGTTGVFGADNRLCGAVSLQPFDLDGTRCVEFMIFFRSEACGTGLALITARMILQDVDASVALPVITLVHGPNVRGKRFYEKAGFHYDRQVEMESHHLELWGFAGCSRAG